MTADFSGLTFLVSNGVVSLITFVYRISKTLQRSSTIVKICISVMKYLADIFHHYRFYVI